MAGTLGCSQQRANNRYTHYHRGKPKFLANTQERPELDYKTAHIGFPSQNSCRTLEGPCCLGSRSIQQVAAVVTFTLGKKLHEDDEAWTSTLLLLLAKPRKSANYICRSTYERRESIFVMSITKIVDCRRRPVNGDGDPTQAGAGESHDRSCRRDRAPSRNVSDNPVMPAQAFAPFAKPWCRRRQNNHLDRAQIWCEGRLTTRSRPLRQLAGDPESSHPTSAMSICSDWKLEPLSH
jgi:hypothetical protein